jgi:hypothetical protein
MDDVFQEVTRNFSIRLQRYIQRNGAHLRDLIFKKWNTENVVNIGARNGLQVK